MIIATAGHIDHGKTTLVRALTGVDGDRLKEEKARGITIELGYAYRAVAPRTAPATEQASAPAPIIGFIDVPGHERFIHTMSAGAVGAAHALLAVAADDGPMPQTREHLRILSLLGIASLSVALTRADRVDAARLEAVGQEMQALITLSGLKLLGIFHTNATDPHCAGVAALAAHLDDLAWDFQRRAERVEAEDGAPAKPFRLAVDRVFTLSGQGTIATGTIFGGRVAVGDTVTHSRTGASARVRSIHAQNQKTTAAHAGQRCALNLVGVDKADMARGDWLAQPQALHASQRLDALLHWHSEDGASLAPWTSVHLHIGTQHCTAHVARLEALDGDGGTAAQAQNRVERVMVQIVADAPVFAHAGDRFIVRNAQATQTLGGGLILDPFARDRRRRSAQRVALRQAMYQWLMEQEKDIKNQYLAEILRLSHTHSAGLDATRLAAWLGLADAPPVWAARIDQAVAVPIAAGQSLLVHAQTLADASSHIVETLDNFHRHHPDEAGLSGERLRRIVATGAHTHLMARHGDDAAAQASAHALWRHIVDGLQTRGEIVRSGPWLHRPSHQVRLSDADERRAQDLLARIHAGGFEPPWVRTLAADTGAGEVATRALLRQLAAQGRVYQIVKDLFFAPQAVAELVATSRQIALSTSRPQKALGSTAATSAPQSEASSGETGITAAAFRDATGLGRKRAVQILEWFDRVGLTRRVGDAHWLRPGVQWADLDGGQHERRLS